MKSLVINSKIQFVIRILIYLAGVIMVSLGIVLCKKSNLGISPVSSVPLVLEQITPLTFGTTTILFHFMNIALQMILLRKFTDVMLWLQVVLAILFGQVIDFVQTILSFTADTLLLQWTALILSVFFTAAGMVCMIRMKLIQNPPDGAVRTLSEKLHLELGKMKIVYDILMVVISAVIGFITLGYPAGFGIATIVSAIFVGRTVTFIQKLLPAKQ